MSPEFHLLDLRQTPHAKSVRFLGRRVYRRPRWSWPAPCDLGLTGWRVSHLTAWLGVPRRTLERWRAWWVHEFVDARFWVVARDRFIPPPAAAALPASLLERFEGRSNHCRSAAGLRRRVAAKYQRY
jgi:hypothetical protein